MDEIRPGAKPLVAAIGEFSLLVAFSADGDIAIIECKLSHNTQAKREVIGQILDNAAHLWKISYEEFDQKIKYKQGTNLAEWIKGKDTLEDWDEESFLANVQTNLKTGNFILLIAVNEINEELSRIVQYVNTSGNPGYAFAALEMRRFQSESIEILVPRVFGPVRAAKPDKKKWDEPSFFSKLLENFGEIEVGVARKIFNWAKDNSMDIAWGEGLQMGSFVPILFHQGIAHRLFAVYTTGVVETYFSLI